MDQALADTYLMKVKRGEQNCGGTMERLIFENEESRRYLLNYEDIESEIGLADTYPLEYLEFPLFSQLLLELIGRVTKTPFFATLRRKSIGPDNLKKSYKKAHLELGF